MNISAALNITEISEQLNARYATELLPLTILLGVLTILGVFGNILTLGVFSASKDYKGRNTFRIFVIALAIIDLCSCLTLFPTEMLTHRYYFAFVNVTLCKTKCFLTVSCASASSLTLLVISVDRFRKVIFPFKKQMTTSMSVKVLFVVALILPIIISTPAIEMCGINKTFKTNVEGKKTDIDLCATEEKYKNSIWRIIYKFVLLVSQLGISVVYIVLYSFVMKEAWKQMIFEKTRLTLKVNNIHGNTNVSGTFDMVKSKQNILDSSGEMLNEEEKTQEPNLTIQILPEKTDRVKGTTILNCKQSKLSVTSQQTKTKFPAKTLVWFVLTLIFILTFMTHLGLTFKVTRSVDMSPNELFWFLFLYRLYLINHVINPVVYAVFLKNFRDSCIHLFTPRFNCFKASS